MLIFTDGSSRRNGKPDCVAGFGVWAHDGFTQIGYETASTSQRGELFGMLHALQYANSLLMAGVENDIYVVSDSAYIVNCIRDKWYTKWSRLGWITSTGTPVKNQDLWVRIIKLLNQMPEDSLHIYQIKGHVKDLEAGYDKFKSVNFGAAPPMEIFEQMVKGNSVVDDLAKHGRDLGESECSDWTCKAFKLSLIHI